MASPRQVTFRITKDGELVRKASPEAIACKKAYQKVGRRESLRVLSPVKVLEMANKKLLSEFPDADTSDMKLR